MEWLFSLSVLCETLSQVAKWIPAYAGMMAGWVVTLGIVIVSGLLPYFLATAA